MHRNRVHAALDGDLPRFLLSEGEEAEARRLEAACETAAELLHRAPVPELRGRVLDALPAAPAAAQPAAGIATRLSAAARGALRWAVTPRTLVLRPAWGLAPALALALLLPVGVPGRAPVAAAPPEEPAAAPAPAVYVQFRLQAAAAGRVSVAGSFTDWEPEVELRESAPGTWTALVPLRPGIHDYLFVVDGEEWIPDPAGYPVDDGFGGTNSRMFLTVPGSST